MPWSGRATTRAKTTKWVGIWAVLLPIGWWQSAAAAEGGASALDDVITLAMKGTAAAVSSQGRIDKIADETYNLLNQYRTVVQQKDSLRIYNTQIEALIANQEAEMGSLREQIATATTMGREVIPLMLRMLSTLEAFVELDVPFLLEERRARIESLRQMMARADVTDAEKFRRILEAYQVENEYGRTIEAYQGNLPAAVGNRTLNFLRLGRVALLYQTLDAEESGMWDQTVRSWQPLSSTYRGAINQGLRIANKQAAPDLLRLPIPAPASTQEVTP